jgi:indole-3-glycerol phosphate synthase
MATGSLHLNRDIILATKRQHIKERQRHTPMEAVLALAQMQKRPRSLLNYTTDGDKIYLIAQIRRTEIYDPVTSALHCVAHGADAVSFFTDHSIYHEDLDDMLLVAQGLKKVPIIYQNYVLDDYAVMAARSADASGLVLYASLLPEDKLRRVVTMAQRWKMFTLIQVNDFDELQTAKSLSPHVLCFGDSLSSNIEATVNDLYTLQAELPMHSKVMLMHTLDSLDEVKIALQAPVDGVIVSEDLVKNERDARTLRALIEVAEKKRHRHG